MARGGPAGEPEAAGLSGNRDRAPVARSQLSTNKLVRLSGRADLAEMVDAATLLSRLA
jgi:hypothetical protein